MHPPRTQCLPVKSLWSVLWFSVSKFRETYLVLALGTVSTIVVVLTFWEPATFGGPSPTLLFLCLPVAMFVGTLLTGHRMSKATALIGENIATAKELLWAFVIVGAVVFLFGAMTSGGIDWSTNLLATFAACFLGNMAATDAMHKRDGATTSSG
ncbi:MAG TPA: hypothetical protein VF272_00440 [Candidatus Saccharimonadia bacterium]